ncbi:hypothetical protein ACE6H2_023434 [Prunus campanulata]
MSAEQVIVSAVSSPRWPRHRHKRTNLQQDTQLQLRIPQLGRSLGLGPKRKETGALLRDASLPYAAVGFVRNASEFTIGTTTIIAS